MEKSKFSLIKAIRSQMERNELTGTELEVSNEGAKELRKSNIPPTGSIQIPIESRAVLSATTAGSGKENVGADKLGILAPLRNSLVLVQAGAIILTGLVGDTALPIYSGSTAKWKLEGTGNEDGAGTYSDVSMSPKRLTTRLTVSKKFLLQDSTGAEEMLMNDLINAVGDKLESTILGAEAGTAAQPAGFFAILPVAPYTGAVTYANVLAMETEVDASNSLKNGTYITNGKGRSTLKNTVKVANSPGYLLEGKEMNGYPVLVTNNVAKNLQFGLDEQGLIFGDFSNLVIGFWGAIDIIVDPYSEAAKDDLILTVLAYVDAKARIGSAFKTATIKNI